MITSQLLFFASLHAAYVIPGLNDHAMPERLMDDHISYCFSLVSPVVGGQKSSVDAAFDAYGRATDGTKKYLIEVRIRELKPSRQYLEAKLKGKPFERILAARLLSIFGNGRSLLPLKEALIGAHPELIVEIIDSAHSLDAEEGLIIARTNLSHQSEIVREISTYVIAREGRVADWPSLVRLFTDKSARVREELIAYGTPPDADGLENPSFLQFLRDSVKDGDDALRATLCNRLSRERNVNAIRLLYSLALDDTSKQIRALALGNIDSWYRKHFDRVKTPAIFGGGI